MALPERERKGEKMQKPKNPKIICQAGRIYFSRESERRFYFILTLIMLIWGILYKIGVF